MRKHLITLLGMSGFVVNGSSNTGDIATKLPAPSSFCTGLAFDGKSMWSVDRESDRIYQISHKDGTIIFSFASPAAEPGGLTWDGAYLWITDRARDQIYRVHPEKGIVVMMIDSPGPYAWGLAWQGDRLWNTDYQNDEMYELEIYSDRKYRRTNERIAEIEFTSDLINFDPGTLTSLERYISEPEDRASQEILDISYSEEADGFKTDKWGQKVACFRESEVPPGERIITHMKVKGRFFETTYHIFPEKVGSLDDIPADIKDPYLQDDEKYQLNHPAIRKVAAEITENETNPYWISRNIFDYLREHLFYKRIGGWDYNSSQSWQAEGPVQLREERIAEWDPAFE